MKTPLASSSAVHTCKVRLFRDEESLVINFQKYVTGEWLLDYTCKELNLVEKYYFGLRYTDQHSHRQWLDLSKPVLKQVKDPLKDSICFRVRYYPAAPDLLREELTRYQLYMQLRRDAFHGRLVPRPSDVPILCALIIQSELGDHEDLELDKGFTKDIDLLPKLAASMEDAIIKAYKELSGLTPADTEARFIERVKSLETYGIDPQPAKDKTGEMLHIGASHVGVAIFQSFRRIKLFEWEVLLKCAIDGKYVSMNVLLSELEEKNRKQTYRYKCPDEAIAKFLWMNILDQQAFFTLHSTKEAKAIKSGGLFRRSNTFRFSGRCYDEVVDESSKILRMPPAFVRASSTSLNRSLSIRNSKRHLALPAKRYSAGSNSTNSVSHSKSLPLGFYDDSPTGDDSMVHLDNTCGLNVSESCIAEVRTPPSTPVPSDKTLRQLSETPEGEGVDMVLTQTMYDPDSGAASSPVLSDSSRRQSVDDYVDSADPDQLLAAEQNIIADPRSRPLYASTPVSKLVRPDEYHSESQLNGDSEQTPIDQPTFSHVSELKRAPTKSNPEIIITNDDDISSWKPEKGKEGSGGEWESAQTNGNVTMQNDNEGDMGEPYIQGTVNCFATPSVDVEEPVDPLSESTRENLKLDLKQLDELSSGEPSPISIPSTPSYHRIISPMSLLKTFLVLALIVLLALIISAYVLFESSYASLELDKIRHLDAVEQIERIYYTPIRQIIVGFINSFLQSSV